MTIKYTPSESQLIDDLMHCYATKFSYAGAMAFIDFLHDIYTPEYPFEWDPVAIGCDFSEYGSVEEWAEEFFPDRNQMLSEIGLDADDDPDEDDIHEGLVKYLHDNQTAIVFFGGVITTSF